MHSFARGCDGLQDALNQALPLGARLNAYHVSTPPTSCAALFAAPAGQQEEKTYLEKHFLKVTGPRHGSTQTQEVPIFGIEVFIYSTQRLTTLFVSKADSTGHINSIVFPKTAPSTLKIITRTFILYLVRTRQRRNRRLVLSLFARSQNTYLFPGSPENPSKHILDDRNLVKWWCRTLDPVVRQYRHPEASTDYLNIDDTISRENDPIYSQASLIVPGHDKYETAAFYPFSVKADLPERKRWNNEYPLPTILKNPAAPPRCLIPYFPDDPKARYLHSLDEELSDIPSSQGENVTASPSKRGKGMWKSVRSVAQFWDGMEFRQECSSGRLVGFIWIVFTPKQLLSNAELSRVSTVSRDGSPIPSSLHGNGETANGPEFIKQGSRRSGTQNHRKKRLTGIIEPRSPRIKSSTSVQTSVSTRPFPEVNQYYCSPVASRGKLVLSQKAYDRVLEILLRLDFAELNVAIKSTSTWTREAAVIAGQADAIWSFTVNGQAALSSLKDLEPLSVPPSSEKVNNLSSGTISRKRKSSEDDHARAEPRKGVVNLLDASSIRKKPQAANQNEVPTPAPHGSVNVLGGAMIRKKPKPEQKAPLQAS